MTKHSLVDLIGTAFDAVPVRTDEAIDLVREDSPTVGDSSQMVLQQ